MPASRRGGPQPVTRIAGTGCAALWLAYFGMLQWSVVQFRTSIVATLTLAALALAVWVGRQARIGLDRVMLAMIFLGSAVIALTVPLFSYLPTGWELAARAVLAGAGLIVAVLLWRGASATAWATAVAAYAIASVIAIQTDWAPKIDVWVTLQQAAEALGRGENFYTVSWVDSPGIQDAFTYLPWTAVLLAPGRWLAGDIRWMQLVWVVVLALGIWRWGSLQRTEIGRWSAAAVCGLILLAPGTLTQIDQAWTEPLLLCAIVWWALLVRSGHPWWAVLPLALACASKQHLALVLPLLLVWRDFGPRRSIATGAAAGLLMAPWFLTAPADFIHDTITLLASFHPIKFANTWYLYALNEHGITPPFWVTGVIVLGTLAAGMLLVARRQPPMGELLRWIALVLLVANLVNKQAFYNQFWLVGALVAISLLADALDRAQSPAAAAAQPAATAP